MLCQPCQIAFPFYLKYCRQCGSKLVKESRTQSNTTQMASLIKRAEIGSKAGLQYCTSPITQQMGKQVRSIAEMLQNILHEFPSLETAKMPDIFIPTYKNVRKMSRTEQLRQTLREFDMSELQELERNSGELEVTNACSHSYSYTSVSSAVNPTQTIEFKRPSPYLGNTLPFSSNTLLQTVTQESHLTTNKEVVVSNRTSQTRSLPSKLLLPNSKPLVNPLVFANNNNGVAFSVRKTLNNLWFRMRDLAENVAINFSVRKSL